MIFACDAFFPPAFHYHRGIESVCAWLSVRTSNVQSYQLNDAKANIYLWLRHIQLQIRSIRETKCGLNRTAVWLVEECAKVLWQRTWPGFGRKHSSGEVYQQSHTPVASESSRTSTVVQTNEQASSGVLKIHSSSGLTTNYARCSGILYSKHCLG